MSANFRLRHTVILLPAVSILCMAPALSQSFRSLTTVMSPRTAALGEAMVAVLGSADPFLSNPAGLALVTGAWTSYGSRGDEPGLTDPGGYQMWEGGLSGSWGTFSIGYHRYERDYLKYAPWAHVPVHLADYTVGAGWGYPLTRGFHVGAALKSFREMGAGGGFALLDAGLILKLSRGDGFSRLGNGATVGLSVQNLSTGNRAERVPGVARLGLSVHLPHAARDSEGAAPLKFLATAELMSTLNTRYQDFSRAAIGVEFTVNERVSFRVGLVAPSQTAGSPTIRYGGGLRLPLPILREARSKPLCIRVDYAAIPVVRTVVVTADPAFGASFLEAAGGSGTIHLFTIGLAYEGEIFPH